MADMQKPTDKPHHHMQCSSRWIFDSDFNKRTGELKKSWKPFPCNCGLDGGEDRASKGRVIRVKCAD